MCWKADREICIWTPGFIVILRSKLNFMNLLLAHAFCVLERLDSFTKMYPSHNFLGTFIHDKLTGLTYLVCIDYWRQIFGMSLFPLYRTDVAALWVKRRPQHQVEEEEEVLVSWQWSEKQLQEMNEDFLYISGQTQINSSAHVWGNPLGAWCGAWSVTAVGLCYCCLSAYDSCANLNLWSPACDYGSPAGHLA